MRVLFLSRFDTSHNGGVERHIENLKKELVSRNHSIRIISSDDIKYPNLKLVGLFYIWFWFFCNLDLIKKSDIVHCHDVFIWYLPFRFLFPRKKVFVTFHGYESYPVKLRAIVIRKLSEWLSFGNICIGEFMKKWYRTNPTYISYGAVDLRKFMLGKGKNMYDACFAGRFDEQTGILTYTKAVEMLRKNTKFKFIALGDGIYKNLIEKTAITPGWVSNPNNYLKKSRFAFSDRYLSILEAFASRKLVFAVCDNPIKKDYLEMTPYKNWIVISKNPKDLAKKILYFSGHKKEANKKIENAYFWVRNQTWSRMADLYERLWFS